METTIIEVEECLTDQCRVCTGYYMSDIFYSKIVCKCKCHISNQYNVKYTNVKTEMEIELLKAEHDSENQNKEMMLGRVGGPESNITLHASTSVNGEENER